MGSYLDRAIPLKDILEATFTYEEAFDEQLETERLKRRYDDARADYLDDLLMSGQLDTLGFVEREVLKRLYDERHPTASCEFGRHCDHTGKVEAYIPAFDMYACVVCCAGEEEIPVQEVWDDINDPTNMKVRPATRRWPHMIA